MGISISGLASNIDTGKYIEAVMAQEKLPLTRLQTKIDKTNAYRNFFNTIKTKLTTLSDAAKALGDLGSFQAAKATSSNSTTLSAVASEGSLKGDYLVNVKSLAKPQVSASNAFAVNDTFTGTGKLTITRNGTTSNLVDLDELALNGKTMDEALAAIATKINGLEDAGVKASVIQTEPGKKTLVLTSTQPGLENSFTLGADNASFWKSTNVQNASDAEIEVNGLTIISSTNEVKDAIPGVTMNLTAQGTSTVKVSQDVSQISSKVEAFVKAYNEIIDMIRTSTTKPEQNSDGTVLTLMGDPLLRDLQSQLHTLMNQVVGEKEGFKLMSEIGLEIDKGVTSASMMTGKITFDKELFAKKMAEDPSAVEGMFNNNVLNFKDSEGQETKVSFSDFVVNNLKQYTDSVDGIVTTKIKGYDAEISYVKEQIASMELRLAKREETLNKQFVSFEVAMSQLNSQMDWISSQFAALTKSKDN